MRCTWKDAFTAGSYSLRERRQTFLQRRFVFTEKLLINNWSRGTEEEGRVEKTQGLQENFFTEELRVKRKPDIH